MAIIALGVAFVTCAGGGAALAGAKAKPGHTVAQSKLLWSTINVCDTVDHPDAIGVRASMPGSGVADEEMFMRFQVQYFNSKTGEWSSLVKGGDSGWVDVGSAKFKARETGREFVFAPPAGRSYELRGLVSFEWREGGQVVRRAKKRTTGKHRSAAGSDPAGFSAATCEIAPPDTTTPPTTTTPTTPTTTTP